MRFDWLNTPRPYTALDCDMIQRNAPDGEPYTETIKNPSRHWFTPWRAKTVSVTRTWHDPRIPHKQRLIDSLTKVNPMFDDFMAAEAK